MLATDFKSKGQFYLVGHSLGGLVSTAYAQRFPENIAHVILFSPAGIDEKREDCEAVASRQKSCLTACLIRRFNTFWSAYRGYSPFGTLRKLNLIKQFTGIFVWKRLKIIEPT